MSEIVDIHPHIVSADEARYPVTPIGGKRSDWSHERSITLEQLIESMDEAGVDKAAVVHSSTTYGFSCEYVSDSVLRHPDRLTGVFSVNVLEPSAPADMKKWFERGCTGMRIFSRGSTLSGSWLAIDDPRIFPCYEYASEKGISIASNITVELFDQLENVLKQFPKVNYVLDHLGRTDFHSDGAPFKAAEPLFRLAKYPNLYLKVATRNFSEANNGKSTSETLFKKLTSEFGANRMAWGSNYPASAGTLKELLQLAKTGLSSLPQADQDWILGKTALHLYPVLDKNKAAAA
ncbi:amidohydrolase family protein [Phyllobacterium lublinensis]|uniref:amidohydrolase family protein n=1 Tax=Phyllobacterium lublinensis TaxID=2875708 RepID=UPI001CC96347|nr:amidohydrolase family protein [Phyllobacterium sp. 2063]MBZ9653731.1 amidohydrolase [Phyllobacterium sp. 2063]